MSELSSVDEETHSSDDEADDPKDTATERSEALFIGECVINQPQCVPRAGGWTGVGGSGAAHTEILCILRQADPGEHCSCTRTSTLPAGHGACHQAL